MKHIIHQNVAVRERIVNIFIPFYDYVNTDFFFY